jgi:lysine 2,3-aminomutase
MKSTLTAKLKLTADERQLTGEEPQPPFRVTKHWLSLLNGEVDDPLRLQVVPSDSERLRSSDELSDPLGEEAHSPLPRLIRRYSDRALVVVTGTCALYCRHCFRRRLSGDDFGEVNDNEVAAIADWLSVNRDVKELLLSGGDPLTLNSGRLLKIIDLFRSSRPDIVLRLATRLPVVDPKRISTALIRSLGRRRPLWVVIQVNHPRELSSDTLKCIDKFQRQGVPVLNQAVLLRGINDDADVLEALFRSLVSAGVKPFYLFQGDLAEGTDHFRLSLADARNLVEKLRGRVSGLVMPAFAVDLPGGGGKVPLGADHVIGHFDQGWKLRTPDGREGYYQDPKHSKEI